MFRKIILYIVLLFSILISFVHAVPTFAQQQACANSCSSLNPDPTTNSYTEYCCDGSPWTTSFSDGIFGQCTNSPHSDGECVNSKMWSDCFDGTFLWKYTHRNYWRNPTDCGGDGYVCECSQEFYNGCSGETAYIDPPCCKIDGDMCTDHSDCCSNACNWGRCGNNNCQRCRDYDPATDTCYDMCLCGDKTGYTYPACSLDVSFSLLGGDPYDDCNFLELPDCICLTACPDGCDAGTGQCIADCNPPCHATSSCTSCSDYTADCCPANVNDDIDDFSCTTLAGSCVSTADAQKVCDVANCQAEFPSFIITDAGCSACASNSAGKFDTTDCPSEECYCCGTAPSGTECTIEGCQSRCGGTPTSASCVNPGSFYCAYDTDHCQAQGVYCYCQQAAAPKPDCTEQTCKTLGYRETSYTICSETGFCGAGTTLFAAVSGTACDSLGIHYRCDCCGIDSNPPTGTININGIYVYLIV